MENEKSGRMSLWHKWNSLNLVPRIIVGLVVGIILALAFGNRISLVGILGSLFVGALRAIAPVLVFVLVISSMAQRKSGTKTNMKILVMLYIIGTFMATLLAATASFIFPVSFTQLAGYSSGDIAPPSGVVEVLIGLLSKVVDNPIAAIVNGNYIGILAWALVFGVFLQTTANDATKRMLVDLSDAVTRAIRLVISFAPLGVMGLVYTSITESGIEVLANYGNILLVLVGTMVFIYFLANPLIAFILMRQNPYPLVFRSLRESGITAFFTRSSAANIPVNLKLCESLGLNKETYSIAVPLGANVAMQGSAATITIMTLATVYSQGIHVSFGSAALLCFAAALGAAGTSGIPGGALLLIPVGTAVFGIPQEVAMQVVGIGFIISVVQDSCETALNSSSDPIWIGAAEQRQRRKAGMPLLDFRAKARKA